MTEPSFTVTAITPNNPHLANVKQLGRKHRKTLGFFPDGAFDDHAARGMLLIAEDQSNELVGYCVYRSSKGRAMIVHLCVAQPFQGNGIARLLFEGVKRYARQCELVGVGLHCRRDYPATQMWPKLGFAPRNTKPGRGADGADLTFWWYDLNARDLWSDIEESDDRLLVVIDCNVFRDLHDDDEERNQEASFLTADWLSGQIQLCIVDELFIEIDRLPLSSPREQWVRDARSYRELKYDDTQSQEITQELKEIFRDSHSTAPQHESDLRYIAKSAAASANVFLTRDGELLGKAAVTTQAQWETLQANVRALPDIASVNASRSGTRCLTHVER